MLKKNILSNEITGVELKKIQAKLFEWNEKAKLIQNKFDFVLPNYIIDEILINEKSKDYLNLHYLINCAVVNGRISKANSMLLKKEYRI